MQKIHSLSGYETGIVKSPISIMRGLQDYGLHN